MSPEQRALAERAITRHVQALPAFHHARRIGIYLAFDGEPSLTDLMRAAAKSGKRLFAPVVRKHNMCFKPMDKPARLAANVFGILEPRRGRLIDARALDLILTPLVAFDLRGVRLGVGRGYYDRCFRFLRHRRHWQKPKLLGVAYELQRVEVIAREGWDIPLWGAVTETGVYRFGADHR